MIIYKTEKEIETIHQGGKILAKILKRILNEVQPGTNTADLENLACKLMEDAGGRPSFKGYRVGPRIYPSALCISINDEVVHAPAVPNRTVKEGDLVSIDVGMQYPAKNGLYTDMAATVAVGKVDKEIKRLIEATKKSLEIGIKQVIPGNSINDIGRSIEDYIIKQGFSVVRDLVGHGVGKAVHEDPQIPNYSVDENKKLILKPGMVLAIEPMVNIGKHHIFTDSDGHTIKTADGSISAHFEHTVAVTKNGHKILTA